ncbi:hypothetical protein GT314_004848 [Salmonella enterica subsp. enterica]|nr:hypothetical protein [Salmonella enterica subsp. enterica serovar Kisangani]
MSDPFSGTGLAGGALTGASVYGLLTGTGYCVVASWDFAFFDECQLLNS